MCISILHDPGEDKFGYERPEERWLPIHTVTTIMMSVISMLADPNDESPANIDAAVCSMLLITVILLVAIYTVLIHKLQWLTSLTGSFLHYSFKNWYSHIKSTKSIIMKAFKNDERCCLCLQKEWRSNRADFRRKVARCVRRSQEDVWYSCSAHTCSTPSSPLTDQ